jgi:hypothetical protein
MIEVIAEKLAEVLGVVFLHSAVQHAVTDRRTLATALSQSTVFRSRRLRVSMAQLLSLDAGQRFVLISSLRRPERVIPIGGAIRYFPSAIPQLEGDIQFTPEFDQLPERYDMRGFVYGRSFVPLLRWFATGTGRERLALAREIEEEMLEIGVTSIKKHLRRPEFELIRVVHEGPKRVPERDYHQYRLFEILKLREECPHSAALADFIRGQAERNPRMALVSTDEIRKGRLLDGRLVGDSAGYLYSESAVGVPPPPLF